MARLSGRDAIAYLLSRLGCVHPFRLSRVLALAELKYMEEAGERLTDLNYVAGPGVFYVEGVKELVEKDSCFYRIEGDPSKRRPGCIGYRCQPPIIADEKARRLLEEAMERARVLSDEELNTIVVEHPLYKRLTGEG